MSIRPEFATRQIVSTAKNRLCIASAYFWPEKTGISQVTWELAEFLAKERFEVSAVTAMPFYPEWQIHREYRGRLWSSDVHNGVRVLRSWHYVRPAPSTLGRLLHEATLTLFALPNLVRSFRSCDYAFIVSPHLTFAWAAACVAVMSRVRFTLIVQDVMPDAAIELGMLTSKPMIALSEWLARRLYAMADEIITLSAGMKSRIGRLTATNKEVRIVPNTIDATELTPPPFEANEFRQRFVKPGIFAVVHAGNMGRKQDLDLLLNSAHAVREDKTIQFFVFGDGADRERFLKRRDELGLANVQHHPLQERRLLPHMLSGADVLLVSQLPEVTDLVVPSKLQTAMGAGAMIVAACNEHSEVARMLESSRGGIVIPGSSVTDFLKAIHMLKADPSLSRQYRTNARQYAGTCFDRRAVYGVLVSELRSKLGRNRHATRLA